LMTSDLYSSNSPSVKGEWAGVRWRMMCPVRLTEEMQKKRAGLIANRFS